MLLLRIKPIASRNVTASANSLGIYKLLLTSPHPPQSSMLSDPSFQIFEPSSGMASFFPPPPSPTNVTNVTLSSPSLITYSVSFNVVPSKTVSSYRRSSSSRICCNSCDAHNSSKTNGLYFKNALPTGPNLPIVYTCLLHLLYTN